MYCCFVLYLLCIVWIYRHTATVQDKCSLKTKSTVSNIRIFLMKTLYNKTKWYHSIVLRKVHQFIIINPCATSKAILQKTHGLHRRSTRNNQPRYTVYKNTGPQSTRITTSMAYDLQFELKSKQAGLTKSKPSIALSKAASYHKANHWS